MLAPHVVRWSPGPLSLLLRVLTIWQAERRGGGEVGDGADVVRAGHAGGHLSPLTSHLISTLPAGAGVWVLLESHHLTTNCQSGREQRKLSQCKYVQVVLVLCPRGSFIGSLLSWMIADRQSRAETLSLSATALALTRALIMTTLTVSHLSSAVSPTPSLPPSLTVTFLNIILHIFNYIIL